MSHHLIIDDIQITTGDFFSILYGRSTVWKFRGNSIVKIKALADTVIMIKNIKNGMKR